MSQGVAVCNCLPKTAWPPTSKTGTNVDQVRAQNAASQAGNSDVEFASETDAQAVRKANQKSKNKMK